MAESSIFRKRRSWHLVPSLHGKQMGKQWKQCQTLFFWGSKITADSDCSHEIKRRLLLGRKVVTNLDSMLKSRDITLPTKVCLVKAMVFLVLMYECECQAPPSMGFSRQECWSGMPFPSSGDLPNTVIKPKSPALQADSLLCEQPGAPTIKKAECQRIDAFELWCWRRLLRVPWIVRRYNQSILKEISP